MKLLNLYSDFVASFSSESLETAFFWNENTVFFNREMLLMIATSFQWRGSLGHTSWKRQKVLKWSSQKVAARSSMNMVVQTQELKLFILCDSNDSPQNNRLGPSAIYLSLLPSLSTWDERYNLKIQILKDTIFSLGGFMKVL